MITAEELINRLYGDTRLPAKRQEELKTLAIGWINAGQGDIAQHTLCLESQVQMNTMADRKQYPLPGQTPLTNCLGIRQVLLDGIPLYPKELAELASIYSNWTTKTGKPLYYLPRMGGFRWWIWLVPIPISNDRKLLIFYYRKPNKIIEFNQGIVVDTELLLKYLKWQLFENLPGKESQASKWEARYVIDRENLGPILRVKQMQEMTSIRRVWP